MDPLLEEKMAYAVISIAESLTSLVEIAHEEQRRVRGEETS